MAALAEVAQPRQPSQEGDEAGGFFARSVGGVGNLLQKLGAQRQQQMGGAARVVELAAGAARQGFGVGEAHAVAGARAACGGRAHGGAQLGRLIVAAEHGHVLKNDAELAHPRRLGQVCGVERGAAARGGDAFLLGKGGKLRAGSRFLKHGKNNLL